MNTYFLSHNCLGDNIANIGAIRFLLNYYENIYFICKKNYYDNLKLLYVDHRIHLIPIDASHETDEYRRILAPIYQQSDMDILVSGYCFTPFFERKITNTKLLNHIKAKHCRIQSRFDFIRIFYEDIGLDLSIFYNYFNIDSSVSSRYLYENIKNYNIIFMHTQCSGDAGNETCRHIFNGIISKYTTSDLSTDYLVICSDHNVYPLTHQYYILVNQYVNLPVAYYIDIIREAKNIYVIDSCFSTIVLPLMNTGRLKTNECQIFHREDGHVIDFP